MSPKKYTTAAERKEAKLLSNQRTAAMRKRREIEAKRGNPKLTEKQKEFARVYPILKNGTKAAIQAGFSEKTAGSIATRVLKNVNVQNQIVKEEKNLKQAFKDAGVDEDYFAVNLKHLVEYNKQVVIEVVGVGSSARDVERMRDAKVVSSTLLQMAKLSGASLENTQNLFASELSVDTMLLAMMGSIKKLAQLKLSKSDLLLLKEISQSIDVLFDKSLQIVG
tara:strand:- start:934 stop:1599 length:666 start_codon:yes stop_codon:yes gene_type:complete